MRCPSVLGILILSFASAALAACSKPSASGDEAAAAAKAVGTANGRCPVMRNLVHADGGGTEYQGIQVGFCCRPCIAKFQADPEKYLKAMREDRSAFAYTGP